MFGSRGSLSIGQKNLVEPDLSEDDSENEEGEVIEEKYPLAQFVIEGMVTEMRDKFQYWVDYINESKGQSEK